MNIPVITMLSFFSAPGGLSPGCFFMVEKWVIITIWLYRLYIYNI